MVEIPDGWLEWGYRIGAAGAAGVAAGWGAFFGFVRGHIGGVRKEFQKEVAAAHERVSKLEQTFERHEKDAKESRRVIHQKLDAAATAEQVGDLTSRVDMLIAHLLPSGRSTAGQYRDDRKGG